MDQILTRSGFCCGLGVCSPRFDFLDDVVDDLPGHELHRCVLRRQAVRDLTVRRDRETRDDAVERVFCGFSR